MSILGPSAGASLNHISAKMYRHRIHLWGLDKNRKEPEMRAIVRKRQDRLDAGKATAFELRGEQIDFDEVVTYFKRKGISVDQVPRSGAKTPTGLICRTPPPPTKFRLPEVLMKTMRVYVSGSLDQKNWYISEKGDWMSAKLAGETYSYNWLDTCLAFSFFSKGMMRDGWRQIRRLNACAGTIIKEENPRMLGDLLWFICTAQEHQKPEIAILTLKQFCVITEMTYGRRHPLTQIFLYALRILSNEVGDIQLFRSTWESILDFCGMDVRRPSLSTTHLTYFENLPDARQSQRRIEELWEGCSTAEENSPKTKAVILSSLSYAYLRTGDWKLVAKTAETLIDLVEPLKDDERFSEHLRNGKYYLAFAKNQLNDFQGAIQHLEESLALTTPFAGRDEGKMLHDLHDLSQMETWLGDMGDHEGATEAQQKRLAITNSMDTFVI